MTYLRANKIGGFDIYRTTDDKQYYIGPMWEGADKVWSFTAYGDPLTADTLSDINMILAILNR